MYFEVQYPSQCVLFTFYSKPHPSFTPTPPVWVCRPPPSRFLAVPKLELEAFHSLLEIMHTMQCKNGVCCVCFLSNRSVMATSKYQLNCKKYQSTSKYCGKRETVIFPSKFFVCTNCHQMRPVVIIMCPSATPLGSSRTGTCTWHTLLEPIIQQCVRFLGYGFLAKCPPVTTMDVNTYSLLKPY